MPEQDYTSAETIKAFLREEARRPERDLSKAQRPRLTLRQLEVFREATQHPTFAATAKLLGISPASVGATVQDIERSIGDGVRLFERGPGQGSTSLTAAGETLAEWSEKLLHDEAAAKSAFSTGERGEGSGDQTRTRGPHVTLHQIEVLLAAAKHDSVRDASQSLGITTQTIRNTMQDLERALGENAQIFRSGTRLTHAGRVLAERGERLLRDEAAMRSAVARAAGMEEENTVRPNHRRNAENVLAAVQFIEQRASAGRDLRFPAALTDALKSAVLELGHSGETVDRVAHVLDLMQASVTDPKDLGAMLEPGGRASDKFRELHEASEQRHAEEVKGAGHQRAKRSR